MEHGHYVLACGNGGSAADAQHFVAELVGRYRLERASIPAVSLTVDPSVLSAIGNDYGFEDVFARQVEALGRRDDVLLAISTSGRSPNVIRAARAARHRGLITIALTGAAESDLSGLATVCVRAASLDTPLIQQAHGAILHGFCELIDASWSERQARPAPRLTHRDRGDA